MQTLPLSCCVTVGKLGPSQSLGLLLWINNGG